MDRILRWRFYNGAEHYRNREAGVKSRADLRQPPLTGPTFLAAIRSCLAHLPARMTLEKLGAPLSRPSTLLGLRAALEIRRRRIHRLADGSTWIRVSVHHRRED